MAVLWQRSTVKTGRRPQVTRSCHPRDTACHRQAGFLAWNILGGFLLARGRGARRFMARCGCGRRASFPPSKHAARPRPRCHRSFVLRCPEPTVSAQSCAGLTFKGPRGPRNEGIVIGFVRSRIFKGDVSPHSSFAIEQSFTEEQSVTFGIFKAVYNKFVGPALQKRQLFPVNKSDFLPVLIPAALKLRALNRERVRRLRPGPRTDASPLQECRSGVASSLERGHDGPFASRLFRSSGLDRFLASDAGGEPALYRQERPLSKLRPRVCACHYHVSSRAIRRWT